MKGIVKWFSEAKGFGFIIPDEGEKDLYVQRSNIKTPEHVIVEGQRVEFEVTKGPKGPEAINVNTAD